MATKGTRVTDAEILRMVQLYEQYGNFKKVGKKLHRSPDTVSKYVHQWMAVHNCASHLLHAQQEPQQPQIIYIPVTRGYKPFFQTLNPSEK